MYKVRYSDGEYSTIGKVENQQLVCINSLGEKCYIPIEVGVEIDIGRGYEGILSLIGSRELVYNREHTMLGYKSIGDKSEYGFRLF